MNNLNTCNMKVDPAFKKNLKKLAAEFDLSIQKTSRDMAEIMEMDDFKELIKRRKR